MNFSTSLPDAIALGETPLVLGRSEEADVQLRESTISRRHATLQRRGQEIVVTDHDTPFGTFVNDIQIRNHRALRGDRIRFGSLVVYRVESEGLRRDDVAHGLRLESTGISLSKGQVPIVEQISFVVEPDSFVGILGPSGAGKSTLLHCLAAYLQPGTGQLWFDGSHAVAIEGDAYRSALGYIAQDDVVYPALTIRENLLFAAQLRLAAAHRTVEIYALVDHTLQRVGLQEHADKANYSGGQRKRLSVAVELLKRPRLLLLDEPTSALDPASTERLMGQLRRLARQGTTVLCTTHLTENIQLFDQILVLGLQPAEVGGRNRKVGRIAYAGPPASLLNHFAVRTYGDLYERLESGAFQLPTLNEQAAEAEATSSSNTQRTVAPKPAGIQNTSRSDAPRIAVGSWAALGNASDRWIQVWLLVWRAIALLCRDRGWLLTLALQPLGLGALVCLTQFRLGAERSVYFFAVVIAVWLGMNNAIRELVRERKHYVRERLAGLRPGAYFSSKLVVCALIGAGQLLLLLAILRLGCTVSLEADTVTGLSENSWAWFLAVLWLCSMGGAGLGLMASALANSEQAAVAILPLLIMPQLLLSAVATGYVDESYDKTRPLRPLAVTLTASREYKSGAALAVDLLSLGCLSRPGALLAESPGVAGYSRFIWLADLCHLLILILGTWGAACFTFLRVEQNWPRLIGLG